MIWRLVRDTLTMLLLWIVLLAVVRAVAPGPHCESLIHCAPIH